MARMTLDEAKARADVYAKTYRATWQVWRMDRKTVLLRAASTEPPAPKAKLLYEVDPPEKPHEGITDEETSAVLSG